VAVSGVELDDSVAVSHPLVAVGAAKSQLIGPAGEFDDAPFGELEAETCTVTFWRAEVSEKTTTFCGTGFLPSGSTLKTTGLPELNGEARPKLGDAPEQERIVPRANWPASTFRVFWLIK
jgi:hypothetical protein